MTLITVFAKTAHGKDGKQFIRYLGRLKKKDGSEINVVLHTTGKAKELKTLDCPANIEFNKQDANLASHKYTTNDGREGTSYALWLKDWKESEEKYVDHSMDGIA